MNDLTIVLDILQKPLVTLFRLQWFCFFWGIVFYQMFVSAKGRRRTWFCRFPCKFLCPSENYIHLTVKVIQGFQMWRENWAILFACIRSTCKIRRYLTTDVVRTVNKLFFSTSQYHPEELFYLLEFWTKKKGLLNFWYHVRNL